MRSEPKLYWGSCSATGAEPSGKVVPDGIEGAGRLARLTERGDSSRPTVTDAFSELEVGGHCAASSPVFTRRLELGDVAARESGGRSGRSSRVESSDASGIDDRRSTIASIAEAAAAPGLLASTPGCSPSERDAYIDGGRVSRVMDDAVIGIVVLVEAAGYVAVEVGKCDTG